MVQSTRVNGDLIVQVDMEFFYIAMVINMTVSGMVIKLTDMGFMRIKLVIITKEIGKTTYNTVTGLNDGQMEATMKDFII